MSSQYMVYTLYAQQLHDNSVPYPANRKTPPENHTLQA